MKVEISALPSFGEVAQAFKDMPPRIDKAANTVILRAALKVEGWAKYYVPVDTGRLKSSIYTDARKMYATIQPSTDYAIYVHNGTKHMASRPFMWQAVATLEKNNWQALTGEMVQELHKELKDALHS